MGKAKHERKSCYCCQRRQYSLLMRMIMRMIACLYMPVFVLMLNLTRYGFVYVSMLSFIQVFGLFSPKHVRQYGKRDCGRVIHVILRYLHKRRYDNEGDYDYN